MKVCQAAARAEFPSFDVVASFKIFNLEAGPSESTDLLDVVSLSGRRKQVEASDSLERLAQVFQVACNQLVIEFELLRNIAEAHIKATGAQQRGVATRLKVVPQQVKPPQTACIGSSCLAWSILPII